MRGHLFEPNIIIPFSIDKSSFGSEAAFHDLVTTGSSRSYFMVMLSNSGIPRLLILSLHVYSKACLKSAVNGPP
jgi:hypothetical protein